MAIFSLLIRRPKTEGRIMKTFVFGQTFWLLVYSVSHDFIYPYIFAGNQGNHQNFIPSLVPIDLWWIWIRMKQSFRGSWKTQFFWVGHFDFFFQKKKMLHSYSNSSQINGYQAWDEILMITLISSKKIGVYKIMRNTVHETRVLIIKHFSK